MKVKIYLTNNINIIVNEIIKILINNKENFLEIKGEHQVQIRIGKTIIIIADLYFYNEKTAYNLINSEDFIARDLLMIDSKSTFYYEYIEFEKNEENIIDEKLTNNIINKKKNDNRFNQLLKRYPIK